MSVPTTSTFFLSYIFFNALTSRAVKGYNVDVKGYNVDVKGYNVDVKGYNLDVKGYNVDVKGICLTARLDDTTHCTIDR